MKETEHSFTVENTKTQRQQNYFHTEWIKLNNRSMTVTVVRVYRWSISGDQVTRIPGVQLSSSNLGETSTPIILNDNILQCAPNILWVVFFFAHMIIVNYAKLSNRYTYFLIREKLIANSWYYLLKTYSQPSQNWTHTRIQMGLTVK